jgi:hypothetical protein
MDTRVSCQRTEFDNGTSNCLQSLTHFWVLPLVMAP